MKLIEITSIIGETTKNLKISGFYKGTQSKFETNIKKISQKEVQRSISSEDNIIVKGGYPGENSWYRIETIFLPTNDGEWEEMSCMGTLIFDYREYMIPYAVYIAFVGSVVAVL